MDVRSRRCSHDSCTKRPSFNVEGSKTAVYCRQHAMDGMVYVHSRCWLHDSCTKHPGFNVAGSKTAAYFKQDAMDGMVKGKSRRSSHDSSTKQPTFNAKGSIAATYCKQHAMEGMVYVRGRRCSHGSCTKHPACNDERNNTTAYCNQHADENTRLPGWGANLDDVATVCGSHKGDLLGDNVVYLKTRCRVDGCRKQACWGLDGKQPTHCSPHGSLQAGLVCTVRKTRRDADTRNLSYGAVKSPSFRVKTECLF